MKRYLSDSTHSDMCRQLLDIRSELDQQRLSLVQHLTTLDAMLLGLLTVFHDKLQIVLFPPSLTSAGVILLFLSLVLGIYYLWMSYILNERVYRQLVRAGLKGSSQNIGSVKAPFGTVFSAKACPIFLCLGTLLLLVGEFQW